MTPDELRAVASRIRYRLAMLGGTRADGADMTNGPNAIDRLADVIEYAEPFAAKQFAGFAAMWDAHPEMVEVVRIARGETNERDKR